MFSQIIFSQKNGYIFHNEIVFSHSRIELFSYLSVFSQYNPEKTVL